MLTQEHVADQTSKDQNHDARPLDVRRIASMCPLEAQEYLARMRGQGSEMGGTDGTGQHPQEY
jgi:hypothetical protein